MKLSNMGLHSVGVAWHRYTHQTVLRVWFIDDEQCLDMPGKSRSGTSQARTRLSLRFLIPFLGYRSLFIHRPKSDRPPVQRLLLLEEYGFIANSRISNTFKRDVLCNSWQTHLCFGGWEMVSSSL